MIQSFACFRSESEQKPSTSDEAKFQLTSDSDWQRLDDHLREFSYIEG